MKAGGGRNKGAAFERLVCELLREAWPDCKVRRGKQSHLADEPDVVVTAPTTGDWRGNLWIECQHASRATPAAKMSQAQHDSAGTGMWPIVVWRATGGRSVSVSMLVDVGIDGEIQSQVHGDTLATLSLAEWLRRSRTR
jgi:hypothetical protein